MSMEKLTSLNCTKNCSISERNGLQISYDSSLERIELKRKTFQYLNICHRSEEHTTCENDEIIKNQEILLRLKNIHSQIGEVISELNGPFLENEQIQNVLSEKTEDKTVETINEFKEMSPKVQTLPVKRSFQILTIHTEIDQESETSEENDLSVNTSLEVLMVHNVDGSRKLKKSKSATEHRKQSHSPENIKGKVLSNCSSAKNVLVKCMDDLNKVKDFLEQEEVRRREPQESKYSRATVLDRTHECIVGDEKDTINVIVDETSPDGKLTISIGGTDGERENIQIVMKKCAECEQYEKKSLEEKPSQEDGDDAEVSLQDEKPKSKHVKDQPKTHSRRKSVPDASDLVEGDHAGKEHKTKDGTMFKKEPTIKKQKKSAESSPKETIKVAFDPENPKNSKVISAHDKDLPITLNETINIIFTSNAGEEFIFSLKVAQKGDDTAEKSFGKPIKPSSAIKESPVYRLEVIPELLPRVRVCQSKELNITTLPTRLRKTGIKHRNTNVETILKELGVENLLRASRPVICGRVAILDEKTADHLPYAASLASLPLEVEDIDIIKQSLEPMNEKNHIVKNENKNKASSKFSVF